jgi:hypothetical protein
MGTTWPVPFVVTDALGYDHLLPGHPNFIAPPPGLTVASDWIGGTDYFLADLTKDSAVLSNVRDVLGNPLTPKAGWLGGMTAFSGDFTVGVPPLPKGYLIDDGAGYVQTMNGGARTVTLGGKSRWTIADQIVTWFADVSDPLNYWLTNGTSALYFLAGTTVSSYAGATITLSNPARVTGAIPIKVGGVAHTVAAVFGSSTVTVLDTTPNGSWVTQAVTCPPVASGVLGDPNRVLLTADAIYPLESGLRVGRAAAGTAVKNGSGTVVWPAMPAHFWSDLDLDRNGATFQQNWSQNNGNKYFWIIGDTTQGSKDITNVQIYRGAATRITAADGHVAAASANFSSATAALTSADVGRLITDDLAGIPFPAYVGTVVDAAHGTLSSSPTANLPIAAIGTVTTAVLTLHDGTVADQQMTNVVDLAWAAGKLAASFVLAPFPLKVGVTPVTTTVLSQSGTAFVASQNAQLGGVVPLKATLVGGATVLFDGTLTVGSPNVTALTVTADSTWVDATIVFYNPAKAGGGSPTVIPTNFAIDTVTWGVDTAHRKITMKTAPQYTTVGQVIHFTDYMVQPRRAFGFAMLAIQSPGFWPVATGNTFVPGTWGAGLTTRVRILTSRPGGGIQGGNRLGNHTADGVQAGREPWHGITVGGSRACTIQDLEIRTIWGDFLYTNVRSPKPAFNVLADFHNWDLQVLRVTMTKCGRQGITCQDAVDMLVEDCNISGCRHQVFDSETPWGVMLGVTLHRNTLSQSGYGFLSIASEGGKYAPPTTGTDLNTTVGSPFVTFTTHKSKYYDAGQALISTPALPDGTYVKEVNLDAGWLRLSQPALMTLTNQPWQLGPFARWRDLTLDSNTIVFGHMHMACGRGKADTAGTMMPRTGLTVVDNVNTSGKLYDGAGVKPGRLEPLIESSWDRVTITGNRHAFKTHPGGTPNAGTGSYGLYWPGGPPPWADPPPAWVTHWAISGNRWTGAIDSQVPDLPATVTALVASPNPLPTTATPLVLTATVTGDFTHGAPTGPVMFDDGVDILGAGTLVPSGPNQATATLTVPGGTLTNGIYNVTASYGGSSTYDTSSETDVVIVAAGSLNFYGLNGRVVTYADLFGGPGRLYSDFGS